MSLLNYTLKGEIFYEIDCMKLAGAGKHSSNGLELHQNKIWLNQCSPKSNHKITTTNECFSTDNIQNPTKTSKIVIFNYYKLIYGY